MRLKFMIFIISVVLPECYSAVSCCSKCDCKPHEVWCEYRGLEEVPIDIPADTRRLYLFNNNISTIPDGVFSKLTKLELLDMSSNQLTSNDVKPGIFDGLDRLQDVILSNNKLTHLRKNTFTEVPSLVRLYLEDNAIENIDEHAFLNLNNLVELKLSRNRLQSFPKLVNCPNLRRLYLSYNHLVRLEDETLSEVNLEQLTLSSNQLNQLPSTVFQDVSNMRQLDLSRNRISRMPRIINNMNSLQTLNLSGNSISFMPGNFLSNLRRMKVLDLRGLRLTTIAKGFIPRRVYLNIFDIADNPWTCDCRILWLAEYMRIVGNVFVGMSQVRCAKPSHLRGRQLVTMHGEDMNCDSDILQSEPSNKRPTVKACDELACVNGAKCVFDESAKRPVCRCLSGWTGILCNEADNIRSIPENEGPAELLIRTDSVTTNSVDILFPSINQVMTIKTSEIETLESASVTVLPKTQVYTVNNLKPGTQYQICIQSTESSRIESNIRVEDSLCGLVRTKDRNNRLNNDDTANYYAEIGQRENQGSKNIGQELSNETSNFKLLLPILAACVSVFIIAAVGTFFLYRKNRQRSKNTDILETMSECRPKSEKLRYASEDIAPMISQHCDYSLVPKSYSGESSVSTHLTDDIYQLPLQQTTQYAAPHLMHRATPCSITSNDKFNLDHNQASPFYFPQSKHLSNTLDNQTDYYGHHEGEVLKADHQLGSDPEYEENCVLNNSRQEYLPHQQHIDIRSHRDRCKISDLTYAPSNHSRNNVNELCQSQIVKDCGYAVGSKHQVHNSLKLHSNYREFSPPPLSHSLRLHADQKVYRNIHRDNEFHKTLAIKPEITHFPSSRPINSGQKTIVI